MGGRTNDQAQADAKYQQQQAEDQAHFLKQQADIQRAYDINQANIALGLKTQADNQRIHDQQVAEQAKAAPEQQKENKASTLEVVGIAACLIGGYACTEEQLSLLDNAKSMDPQNSNNVTTLGADANAQVPTTQTASLNPVAALLSPIIPTGMG